MTSVTLGSLTITADFDSGNFLRAELVDCPKNPVPPSQPGPSQSFRGQPIANQVQSQDYEVNIWTKPDCHGTAFENANRTWFYFGIKGGTPHAMVKINILNLNKQTKLFMQGMAPVCRILPEKPSWERIKDKISINENKSTENVCSISFRQKLPDNPEKSTLYIAFTYPLSYLEMCDSLKKMDQFYKINSPLSPLSAPKRRELWMPQSTENEIYYHRECVCYSLEEKRVELLTISSINGISDERELRLSKLFPIEEEPRPFTFPGKKVVFLSARVHPGETPSSFVLNGFLKFILDKSDPRAVILRRLFVFKIIPILNPDGVYKGHYRTDPRGVNLNRMYLNPSPVLHPSIYAARKLLMFYHNGLDAPDDFDDLAENEMSLVKTSTEDQDKPMSPEGLLSSCQSESACQMECGKATSVSEDYKMQDQESPSEVIKVEKKPYTFVLSDANSLCAGCGPFEDDNARSCLDENPNPQQTNSDLVDESITNLHQCAFESCDDDSVYYENLKLCDTVNNNMEIDQAQSVCTPTPSTTKNAAGRPSSPRRKKKGSPKSKKKGQKISSSTEVGKDKKQGVKKISIDESLFSGIKQPPSLEPKSTRYTRSQTISGSKSNSRYYDSSSGLFLYVDMHGHTTKRGIFMYGNHFSDFPTQAECMLVPRLMAINSPHFDFAACNFTERLMCVKDRGGGASREGSGRVACLKLTGLIRSYTLECNYNTGRLVNQVVARPPSYGFLDPSEPASFHPPKYTIELFEGIGKSLAETLLDMTGHNPWSRLTLTEFKTLDGVKRSLVSRLKLSAEYKGLGADISAKKSTSSAFETNPLLQSASSIRVIKKPRSKVLVQSQPSGPLGPRRENQNSPANAKPSGSQTKKLPVTERSDGPIPGSSTSLKALEKSTLLPKSSLTKVMKKKSFPKFASSKIKKSKRKQKPDTSDKLPN